MADQARIRQDLGLLRPGDEIALDLRTLTARRLDLVNDRTRQTRQSTTRPARRPPSATAATSGSGSGSSPAQTDRA
ncbi:hypothetical protein ACH47Z_39045 [Streptomyces sp. NPDC020192]|uniref:hypothetical protein n=1 Tax=Streptomyces sp. NPDC020192 TaxID=3365066 RepID=UPI0037B36B3F